MRTGLIVLWMLLCSITSAAAQVSVGIGLPGVSIGISVPVYPQLVLVPGYPVYYAPQVNSNYFFYDGLYWVYAGDNWYASSWYNGPWELVAPEVVPLFVLRVPVRYYRRPPAYFHGWRADAPPRWGEHWGDTWAQRRSGWDNWNRSSAPPPAPLPVYQRQYSGNRYPRVEQQQVLQTQNYRYQPQDAVARQHYQAPRVQSAPAPTPQTAPAPTPQARQAAPREKITSPQDQRGSKPPSSLQQGAAPAPQGQSQQKGGGDGQKAGVAHPPPQQSGPIGKPQGQPPQQTAVQHEQKASRSPGENKGPQSQVPAQEPRAQRQPKQLPPEASPQQAPKSQGEDRGPQGKGSVQEPKQGPEKGRDKGDKQGGERNN